MDFYEELASPYVQVVSIPFTTNLPSNTKWWKVKNKDWSAMCVKKEINHKYIAKVSLSNSLNTLGTNDLMFTVIDSSTDQAVYFNSLYESVITKDELISMIKQLATELISNINDMGYQIMCIDDNINVITNRKVYVAFFDLKTGEYIENNKLAPITLTMALDL